VRMDVPVLFVPIEIGPSEHVTGWLTAGVTLHASVRAEGLSPPVRFTVMVDFADAPGATEDGDGVVAERLKLGASTTTLTTVDVLTLKLPSPLYAALMLWVPAVSAEVENVATPLAFNVEVPSCAVPSIKLTVPVGEPAVPGVTVAVKVTD
jgi:hypothetical protein